MECKTYTVTASMEVETVTRAVQCQASQRDRVVGLVVEGSASRTEDPGFESRLRRDFSGSSHTSDLQNWHSSGYPARRPAI